MSAGWVQAVCATLDRLGYYPAWESGSRQNRWRGGRDSAIVAVDYVPYQGADVESFITLGVPVFETEADFHMTLTIAGRAHTVPPMRLTRWFIPPWAPPVVDFIWAMGLGPAYAGIEGLELAAHDVEGMTVAEERGLRAAVTLGGGRAGAAFLTGLA